MALGDAYIDVNANFDPFERQVDRGVQKAGRDADKLMDGIGDKWGDTLADSTSRSLGSHGRDFADAVSDSTRGQTVETHWGLRDSSSGRFVRQIENQAEQAFSRVSRSGGPVDKLTEGISDAIGAGFNISGRSPLIAVLIPAVGALVGVLLAAVQAANALVAILTTVPALIAAIGLQVGVLMLAFEGIGSAATAAFAAKNATELNEALKNLTPSAQAFVRSLLPAKIFFRDLKSLVQENFFAAFGDTITKILDSLRGVALRGMAQLATALGGLFRDLGLFFASAQFRDFLANVIPATVEWLSTFGPAFTGLLRSLIGLANTAMPFLSGLGDVVTTAILKFNRFIDERVKDGTIESWLDTMLGTVQSLSDLFFSLSGFVATFMDALSDEGGQEIIDKLTEAVTRFTAFIESPVGRKAIEGLVNSVLLSIEAFTGLLIIVGLVVAAFQFMGEAIDAFLTWFTVDFLGGIGQAWADFMGGALKAVNNIQTFFKELPGKILIELGKLRQMLFTAGANAIRSFGDGVGSMWQWVRDKALSIVAAVTDVLPGSPAKTGPLSGSGYSKLRGERMVTDFMAGMQAESGALRETSTSMVSQVINFGGIRQEFSGALPTDSQARTIGAGVGTGIVGQMARRDLALAVRSI